VLVGAALVSAAFHLLAEYRGPHWLVYVAKPLTTSLLVIVAAMGAATPYRNLVVLGLLLSLAGDVFLLLPKDRFIAGLVSFLLAHIAYVFAFGRGVAFGARPLLLLPFVALAAAVLWFLWPRLGRLHAPVTIYVIALVLMAWQAATRASVLDAPSLAIGGTLFVVSDGVLAINRFRFAFRAAQAVVMTTYVIAQALIATSVS